MNKTLWKLLCGLVVVTLALSVTGSVYAKSVVWRDYNFDITVQPNGDLRVVETQVIEFQGGPFREGFAQIALANTDGIDAVSLSEAGQVYAEGFVAPNGFTVSNTGDYLEVVWGLPQVSNETRTFVLAYTVHGAVRQYESGDKINYNIVSPVSSADDYTIYSSKITVHLPPGGQIINDPDSVGAALDWQTALDNLSVTFQSPGAYNASEGLAIELIFRHGAISGPQPSWQAEFDKQVGFETNVKTWIDLGLWALTLALFVVLPGSLYLIWYLNGRDPSAAIAPDYLPEPPSDLPPGLVGVLVDEQADMRDITATVIDLARRGFLILEEQEAAGAFGLSAKSYTLRKGNPPANLRDYERQLYRALIGNADSVNMQSLPSNFFNSLNRIESLMYAETVKADLFRANPESVRTNFRGAGIAFIVLTVLAGFTTPLLAAFLSDSVLCLFIPAFLFGIGLIGLSGWMPARTRKGAAETAKWRAFQKYLGNIQQYKDVASVADQFDRFLPYAVAFGLERRWVNAFAQAPTAAAMPLPLWYRPWRRPIVPGAAPGGASAVGGAPALQAPNLNQMGAGLTGGLNSMGDSFVNALNAAGRSLSTPPAPKYTYSGGGSRGSSGGGHRSTFRSGGGGGFRSSSGGGRRGFR